MTERSPHQIEPPPLDCRHIYIFSRDPPIGNTYSYRWRLEILVNRHQLHRQLMLFQFIDPKKTLFKLQMMVWAMDISTT